MELFSDEIGSKYQNQSWEYPYPSHIRHSHPKSPRILKKSCSLKAIAIKKEQIVNLENIRHSLELQLQKPGVTII